MGVLPHPEATALRKGLHTEFYPARGGSGRSKNVFSGSVRRANLFFYLKRLNTGKINIKYR